MNRIGNDSSPQPSDGSNHFSQLKEIRFGKSGLTQLLKSQRLTSLDQSIRAGKIVDKPCGPALKDSAHEKSPQRNKEYHI